MKTFIRPGLHLKWHEKLITIGYMRGSAVSRDPLGKDALQQTSG